MFLYRALNKVSICFVFLFFIQSYLLAQEREVVDNGIVLKRFGKKRVTGKFLNVNNKIISIEKFSKDTIQIPLREVLKTIGPKSICLYNNGRFHYKNSFLYNYSCGISNEPFLLDFALSYRYQDNVEFGLGIGVYANSFQVYTSDNIYNVRINSRHFYAVGKYYFYHSKPVRIYIKGMVGFANNRARSQQISEVKNGYSLSGSIGVLLPAKRRVRHYFEIGQRISNTAGTTEITGLNTKIDFDVVFFRLSFTYGIELGQRMKRVNGFSSFL